MSFNEDDLDDQYPYSKTDINTPSHVVILHLEINPDAFPDVQTARSVKKIVMDNL